MKATLASTRPMTALLALLSIGFAVILVMRIWQGTSAAELLATAAQAHPLPVTRLDEPQRVSDLAPIRNKALFYASRRFFVPPLAPATPAAPPAPDYRLVGTFVIPRKPTIALLVHGTDGASRKVRPGDAIDGWTVQSVEKSRVVLEYEAQHVEI